MAHAVSNYEAEMLKKDFGVDSMIIEHGVDEWLKNVDWKPENYILCSGRVEKYKNIEKLARITKILDEDYRTNLKLKVCGDGPHRDKLAKYMEKLGLEHEIAPFRPHSEYIDILSRARLLANLSEKEALSLTVNEAHAIEVPAMVAKP